MTKKRVRTGGAFLGARPRHNAGIIFCYEPNCKAILNNIRYKQVKLNTKKKPIILSFCLPCYTKLDQKRIDEILRDFNLPIRRNN